MNRCVVKLMASCSLLLLPLGAYADEPATPLTSSTGTISWSTVKPLSEHHAQKQTQAVPAGKSDALTSSTGKIIWSEVQPLSEFQAQQSTAAAAAKLADVPATDAAALGSSTGTITWSTVKPLSAFEEEQQAKAATSSEAVTPPTDTGDQITWGEFQELSSQQALPAQQTTPDATPADVEQAAAAAGDAVYTAESQNPIRQKSRMMELQRYLLFFGYDIGDVDGEANPRTMAALQAWQRSRSLTPDASVSEALLDQMATEIHSSTTADSAL